MIIGPHGIDPLEVPGELILIDMDEDEECTSDDSRNEVHFCKNCIAATCGVTGHSISILTSEFQEEQLMHWLRARIAARQGAKK